MNINALLQHNKPVSLFRFNGEQRPAGYAIPVGEPRFWKKDKKGRPLYVIRGMDAQDVKNQLNAADRKLQGRWAN